MPNLQGRRIITELIRDYYRVTPSPAPYLLEQREFGFGTFDDKIAFRHMAFKKDPEFRKYLVDTAPAFVDCSPAYYRFPDARPMEKKEWLGSDLGFDIDANDVPTACKLKHGSGWLCDECLEAVKAETVKLVEEFLMADFGFSEREVEMNFSGNRGYHVHVRKKSALQLDASARAEMSGYIRGSGVLVKGMFPSIGERGKQLLGPKLGDLGWYGRVARGFSSALESEEKLASLVSDPKLARKLHEKRSLVVMGLVNGNWDMIRMPKKDEVVTQMAERIISRGGVRIDENVTKDPSHLMRLPNTIHGGSGLVARKLASLAAVGKFDPMRDAIAFKGRELKVKADSKYGITMNGEAYGPFKDETVTLPVYVATYLYLKGVADIVSVS
jgi:DNA primase small subunit